MVQLTTSRARQEFSSTLKSVSRGERVLLSNHGKSVGAIVSVEDLQLLQALEDRIDLAEARKALAEIKTDGTVSWDELKDSLGL